MFNKKKRVTVDIRPNPSRLSSPQWVTVPHYRGFTITLRHITLDKTPLD